MREREREWVGDFINSKLLKKGSWISVKIFIRT